MSELQTAAQEQLQGYRDKVGKLGEYDPAHVDYAFGALEGAGPTPREQAVMTLLRRHVADFSEHRRADLDAWREEFRVLFESFSDS